MKRKFFFVILVLSSIILSSCTKAEDELKNTKISDTKFMLDTVVTITAYGTEDENLLSNVFSKAEELENTLSAYIENSDVYNINQKAGLDYVTVSDETIELISKSLEYSIISEGLFDITTGPLIDLWSIDPPNGHVPTLNELKETLPLIDYKNIVIDQLNNRVFLSKDNMAINLGAIAKGYIVDKMVEEMLQLGNSSAIINAGGNIYVLGSKPDNSLFRIGIQDPDSERGEYLGILKVTNKSIVTSGGYERYFIKDGIKYHHILDPITGFPAENEIKAVSIISDTSTDGDALSTSTLLLGLEKGYELIESLDGVDAIFITKDNKIYMTGNINEIFELTSDNYKISNIVER